MCLSIRSHVLFGLDRHGLRGLPYDAAAIRWRYSLFAVIVVGSACLATAGSIADCLRQ